VFSVYRRETGDCDDVLRWRQSNKGVGFRAFGGCEQVNDGNNTIVAVLTTSFRSLVAWVVRMTSYVQRHALASAARTDMLIHQFSDVPREQPGTMSAL
jgi:hypothetical protein